MQKSIEIHRITFMNNESIEKLTNEELRNLLREFRKSYIFSTEPVKNFKKKVMPYLNELNTRLHDMWLRNGAEAVSKRATQLSYKNFLSKGI